MVLLVIQCHANTHVENKNWYVGLYTDSEKFVVCLYFLIELPPRIQYFDQLLLMKKKEILESRSRLKITTDWSSSEDFIKILLN